MSDYQRLTFLQEQVHRFAAWLGLYELIPVHRCWPPLHCIDAEPRTYMTRKGYFYWRAKPGTLESLRPMTFEEFIRAHPTPSKDTK